MKIESARTFLAMTCLILMVLTVTPKIYAEAAAEISIDPVLVRGQLGDNVTVTVRVDNVWNLISWQVALVYSSTVAICTATWLPEDNIFAGKNYFAADPVINEPTMDGFRYVLISASLVLATVDVSSGVLCKINFTLEEGGQSALTIATRENPAQFGVHGWDIWFSLLSDADENEIPFTTESGTLISGEFSAKPVASFSAISSPVDNRTNLVVDGRPPVGASSYVQSYIDTPILFNASTSYDREGEIVRYVWDFGDGNTTETSGPLVTHVYNLTGNLIVSLTVWNNGNPPASSEQVGLNLVLGLVLPYLDWTPFIYGVMVFLIVAAVILAIRRVRKGRQLPAMV